MTLEDLLKEFDEARALKQCRRGREIIRRLQHTLIRMQDCVHDDDEANPACESVADAWARWKTPARR